MNNKGQVFIILVYVLGIIMIGFTLLVLSGPLKTIFDSSANSEDAQDSEFQEFYTRAKTTWIWIPLLLIFPMILWAFSKAHERQGYG